ncbi:alpha-L-fucosidase [Capnocytophaga canis]|uniref:alpha-L-fucosidase n=1 Tax=Capnocytophaga canis TaxID=1848903 RepID=A0A0B7IVA4_9FLAO|nr:alpha-L-fucosidase [Capnocytophaga canis]CEN53878.1 Alpha-L-fucoside fucohydrolase 2 [Capnocytophaga canis]
MKTKNILLVALIMGSLSVWTQPNYKPSAENLKARSNFQDDKFGIFIHWGLYSMLSDGEWVMHNKNLHWQEYEKLAGGFYPAKFNAAEWVSAIKASGAKYITITTRHHDGFSMFNTKHCDYNIVKATPFKRDIIKEIADECKKQGIRLHLYYSHLDWRRNDYYPLGRTGKGTGRTTHGKWEDYHKFMNNQLTELLTNYGEIGAIWFDGMWDKDIYPDGMTPETWNLHEQYQLIHNLQPACLIGNNHHLVPFTGEDIQIFERDLPGENKAGLSGQDISKLPLETCETMNGMWGYKIIDQNYKSTETLIQYLVKAAGKNANLLMNVGPQPDGMLPAVAVQRLKEMGEWMKKYAPTIQGTRGGVITPRDWGVTTQRNKTLYVHVLDWKDKALFLPYAGNKLKKAIEFDSKKNIQFSQDKDGIWLKFPKVPTAPDYVIELTFENKLTENQ